MVLKQIIFYLFLFIGYFSPLALASVDLWSQTIIHILSIIIAFLWVFIFWNKKTFEINLPYWRYIVLWLVWCYISYRFAANRQIAQTELYNVINGIFFFYLAVNIEQLGFSLQKYLQSLRYIIIPLILLSIYQINQNPQIYQDPSSLINPNIFASYLILWIPFLFNSIIKKYNRQNIATYLFLTFLLILSLVGLYISHSMASVIFLIIAIMFMYIKKVNTIINSMSNNFAGISFKIYHKVATLIIFILVSLIFVLDLNITSLMDRIHWIRVSFFMITQHPIWGLGLGGFGEAFLYFKNSIFRFNTLYAHNFIFHMLSEIGIIGTVVFCLFLGKIIWRSIKSIHAARAYHFLLVGWFAFLLKEMIDYSFFVPATNFIFWIWTGFIVAHINKSQERVAIPIISKTFLMIVGIIILLMIPGTIKPFIISQKIAKGRYEMNILKNYPQAKEYFDKALFLNPLYPEAYFEYGQLWYKHFIDMKDTIYLELSIVYTQKALKYSKYNKRYQLFLQKITQIHSKLLN